MRHAQAIGFVAILAAVAVGCSKKEGERKPDPAAPAQEKPAPAAEPAVPPGAVTAPAIDACTLVSKADVEAASKGKVSDPKADVAGNMATCLFGDPDGNAPLGRVRLIALNAGSAGAAKSIHDMVANDPKDKREAVAGVGEAASLKSDEYASHLLVLKGAYTLEVSVNLADKSLKRDAGAERTAATEIAKKAVGKLP